MGTIELLKFYPEPVRMQSGAEYPPVRRQNDAENGLAISRGPDQRFFRIISR
jgi:hypothetical protein